MIDAADLARMRADTLSAKEKCAWHVNVAPDKVLALIDELEKAREALECIIREPDYSGLYAAAALQDAPR